MAQEKYSKKPKVRMTWGTPSPSIMASVLPTAIGASKQKSLIIHMKTLTKINH